jgi:hypothetical protein
MIPRDLRDVPQWLVSGLNKIPISPKTGFAADIRQRELHVSYDDAVTYASQHSMDIGFVLTPEDPFVVIDLDAPDSEQQVERHTKIYEAFQTYAELSRSGKGVHIWCRGSLPRGVRRDKVEVYPQDRYMITTGQTLKDLPVVDCQPLLDLLFNEMDEGGYGSVQLEELEEVASDADIFDMAINAVNGDKFDRLCKGQWQDEYPSQSEADFALMDMLCFYTRSNDQAKRLFRYSALGKREKAQRDKYLEYMIRKIRAEELPMVDFSGLSMNGLSNGNGTYAYHQNGEGPHRDNNLHGDWSNVPSAGSVPGVTEAVKQETPLYVDPPEETNYVPPVTVAGDFVMPPGFVGEIAQYIYQTSTRPVKEVATAAAIALCAGVVGRQFNISGTGLNQYLILLAKTGVGKEDGPRGIERILKAVRETVPVVDEFIGPGTFASGQSIVRTLDTKPCFLSILGEFGLTLQELSDVNQTSLSRVMRRVMLDLWAKSGKSSVLPPSAYSDSTKNTKILYAPCMTLLGESTPETFYEGLSLHHIESGLIPRFLIIEFGGDRSKRNPDAFTPPPAGLVKRFADLAEVALRMQANNSWADVEIRDDAHVVLNNFDIECDRRIRSGGNEAIRQLWNRAHLKALRLSALLAVADRPHTPVIWPDEAKWAIDLVREDTARVAERFEKGDVGEGDSKQNADLERIINDFVVRPLSELASYGVTSKMKEMRCVPAAYLQRRTSALSSFRKDRKGARNALRDAIGSFMESGRLQQMPKQQVQQVFGTTQSMFFVREG